LRCRCSSSSLWILKGCASPSLWVGCMSIAECWVAGGPAEGSAALEGALSMRSTLGSPAVAVRLAGPRLLLAIGLLLTQTGTMQDTGGWPGQRFVACVGLGVVVLLRKTCSRLDMANSTILRCCGDFLSDFGRAVCFCEVDWQKCKGLAAQVHD
jgi:hypothetical protein